MRPKTPAIRYVTILFAATLGAAAAPAIGIGDTAPDFDIPEADGGRVTLSEHLGKVVLLNFWASWCGPCKEELPVIETDFQQVYGPDDFTAISVNQFDALAIIALYKHGLLGEEMTFPFGHDEFGTVFSDYSVSALPRNFLIDQDGIITWTEEGFTESIWKQKIEELLGVGVQSTSWGALKAGAGR